MRLLFRRSEPAGTLGLTLAMRCQQALRGHALLLALAIGASAGALGQTLVILHHYPPVTALYGGAGGTPVAANCAADEHLIGARVFVGDTQVVAGVSLLCGSARTLDTTGAVLGSQQGTPVLLRCPAGWRAVGIWGASGALVDRFSLSCAQRAGGPVVHLRGAGGRGGVGFHASCPQGALRGLNGRAGALLDSIGMVCDEAWN